AVYSDLSRSTDVTNTATISPTQPITGANSQTNSCVSTITVSFTIPANGIRVITIHLDFNAKGTTGYASNAANTYRQPFLFSDISTITGYSPLLSMDAPFT